MYALTKVLIIYACCQAAVAAAPCQSLNELNWLLGDWQSSAQQTFSHESWQKLDEQTFTGRGLSLNQQGQQSNAEDLRLLAMQGQIFYLAKVSHNPFPVAFKAVSCEAQQVVFENPRHDFPNRLHYALQENGSLLVTISAMAGDSAQHKSFSIEFQPNKKAD